MPRKIKEPTENLLQQGAGKVGEVIRETEKVTEVLDENIELQLANLQAGDDLERKAEELRAGTEIFRDAATRNRRNECCKKWKLQILTGGCCLAVVGTVVIVLAVRFS